MMAPHTQRSLTPLEVRLLAVLTAVVEEYGTEGAVWDVARRTIRVAMIDKEPTT